MDNDTLFALRTYYQDYYQDENDIIQMLKTNIIDQGDSSEIANQKLYNFYKDYGIDIDISIFQEIKELPSNQELLEQFNIPLHNILNNVFNNLARNSHNTSEEILNNNDENLSNDEDTDEDLLDNEDTDGDLLDDEDTENNEVAANNENNNTNNENNTSNLFRFSYIYPPSSFQSTSSVPYFQSHIEINNLSNLISNIISEELYNLQTEDVICTLDESEKDKLKKSILTEKVDNKIYDCNVCLEEIELNQEIIELPCEHIYHSECIEKYLNEYNYKCPSCRKEVGKPKYNL
jgi:hypothetical protein